MSFASTIGAGLQRTLDEAARQRMEKQRAESLANYEQYYQPIVQEYARLGQQASGNLLEREMAKLRMRLGYNQSAGAGTGGWWNLARSGMETAGMQKGMALADQWKQWEAQQHLGYLSQEDQQAHQLEMQRISYQNQLALMKQQAELNDSSWWSTLGTIAGIGLALWNPLAGAAVAGGGAIVGRGVGGSWSASD